MAWFEYRVKDRGGRDHTGLEEANDVGVLITSLRTQGYFIVKVQEVKKGAIFSRETGKAKVSGKGGGVKLDDLVIFSRQMATLVAAGIPLIQAIDILEDQVDRLKLKLVLRDVHQEIEGGKSFSDSLRKHKKVFSEIFINLSKAGETSGSLDIMLDRIATYLEKSSALQKKVKSAMIYPASVVSLAFLITYGMLVFVIPKFAQMFEGLHVELPAPTRFLMDLSHSLSQNWILILGMIIGSIFGFRALLKLPAVRIYWDGYIIKMPVFGGIITKVAVSKFSRTLATLIKSGVPILASLEIVSRTAGNLRMEKVILSLMDSVKRGENLSGPLGKSLVFPPMVVRMIGIGEETGELEAMLLKIADFYDTEVDTAVDGLTSLIEPLLIAFLGVVIGGIVISMFLPILTIASKIH